MSGKTSSWSKDQYNERVYARYSIRIRKDTDLYLDIKNFTRKKDVSLNGLVTDLLHMYFSSTQNNN